MINCDVDTTVSNVKDFFKYDFWHYMNLGGIHVSQLSSPQMDLTGATHSNTNGVENSKHQTILRSAYINELTDYQIEIKLSFSDYQLRREKKKACIEFAERLEFWCKRRNVNDLPLLMSY